MAEAPFGASGDGDGGVHDVVGATVQEDIATEYTLLKARFKLLQADALELADSYEAACQELRDEQERQAVMVAKLAEIRVRQMNAFLRVPENGMMFFLEHTKQAMRSRYPMASRREIRRLLLAEWESMPDDEQQAWTTRLNALVLKHRKKDEGRKSITSSSARRSSKTSSGAVTARLTSPTASSARTPKGSAAKRKAPNTISTARDASEEKRKKKPKTQSSVKEMTSVKPDETVGSKTKPRATSKPKGTVAGSDNCTPPRPKAAHRPKKVKTEKAEADGKASASVTPKKRSSKKVAATDTDPTESLSKPARKSPTKPKKATVPKEKVPTPKKTPTPKKKPAPKTTKPKVGKKFMKTLTTDSEDDDGDSVEQDDDDDDEDDQPRKKGRSARDDDSQSSGGGSGSEEDDDEHMAQLPTGAFG